MRELAVEELFDGIFDTGFKFGESGAEEVESFGKISSGGQSEFSCYSMKVWRGNLLCLVVGERTSGSESGYAESQDGERGNNHD